MRIAAVAAPPDLRPVDAATDGAPSVAAVLADIAARVRHIEQVLELVPVLLAAHGDPTHLSVENTARVLGVSVRTIRRRIAAGDLVLETIPGTRTTGIPVTAIYSRWTPLHLSRESLMRERKRIARK